MYQSINQSIDRATTTGKYKFDSIVILLQDNYGKLSDYSSYTTVIFILNIFSGKNMALLRKTSPCRPKVWWIDVVCDDDQQEWTTTE